MRHYNLTHEYRRFVKSYINGRVDKTFHALVEKNKNLINQNTVIIRRFANFVALRKHYLRHRLPTVKRKIKLFVTVNNLKRRIDHNQKILKSMKYKNYPKNGMKYFLRLSAKHIGRLTMLLKYDIKHLPRPKKGKYYPQLDKRDLRNFYNFVKGRRNK